MGRAQGGVPSENRWMGGALNRLERWAAGPVADASLADTTPPATDGPLAERPRVLVVDDNPVNRLLAGEILSLWGISPMLAADGAEAVALACGHDFDLILMDLRMPILDGLAATTQIRRFEQENASPRAPVVAYTSRPLSGNEHVLRACGMDAVLEKPCDAATLHACLRRWCPSIGADAAQAARADTDR